MSQNYASPVAATGQRTTPEPLYGGAGTGRRITVRDIAAAKARGEKWPMLTAYDALSAGIFDRAGIPVLLVGDSAAMVVYGHESTIPVTVDELIPLTAAVVRGTSRALVVADLPFGSYQASPGAALSAAVRFLKESGAHAVKLEGGQRVAHQVEDLVAAGIPVMAHLGLTPQSVNALGGYRVQGRGEDGQRLLQDAKVLEAAGAFAVVLECVPTSLAAQVTEALSIPTIGIGPALLRRAGAGLAGHGGPVPAGGEVRQEVRRPGRRPRRGRDGVRRGGHVGRLPGRGALLPLGVRRRPARRAGGHRPGQAGWGSARRDGNRPSRARGPAPTGSGGPPRCRRAGPREPARQAR